MSDSQPSADYGGKALVLVTWLLVAAAYSTALQWFQSLTGNSIADGAIGIALGLYVCSKPAANLLDIIFAQRGARRPLPSRSLGAAWLALNVLTMLVGWFMIASGAAHLATHGA